MFFKSYFLATAALVSYILVGATSPAHADQGSIQMLPPTDYTGQPCSIAHGTNGILQWDGQTSVRCVPGASGDQQGNFNVSGYVKPGSNNIQAGNSCPTEGAIAYDKTSDTHQLVYCNATLQWAAAMGGGTTGWVDSRRLAYTLYENDGSVDALCKTNGYTFATGLCTGYAGSADLGVYVAYGVLQFGDSAALGGLGWTCVTPPSGSGAYLNAPSAILCSK